MDQLQTSSPNRNLPEKMPLQMSEPLKQLSSTLATLDDAIANVRKEKKTKESRIKSKRPPVELPTHALQVPKASNKESKVGSMKSPVFQEVQNNVQKRNASPLAKKPSKVRRISNRMEQFKLQNFSLQLKKKDTDLVNLKRKMNLMTNTLEDKEKALKEMEAKIPKLASRNAHLDDERTRRANKELKECLKLNSVLTAKVKKVEGQLFVNEAKLKISIEEKNKVESKLKSKDKECRDLSKRLTSLECQIVKLQEKNHKQYHKKISVMSRRNDNGASSVPENEMKMLREKNADLKDGHKYSGRKN